MPACRWLGSTPSHRQHVKSHSVVWAHLCPHSLTSTKSCTYCSISYFASRPSVSRSVRAPWPSRLAPHPGQSDSERGSVADETVSSALGSLGVRRMRRGSRAQRRRGPRCPRRTSRSRNIGIGGGESFRLCGGLSSANPPRRQTHSAREIPTRTRLRAANTASISPSMWRQCGLPLTLGRVPAAALGAAGDSADLPFTHPSHPIPCIPVSLPWMSNVNLRRTSHHQNVVWFHSPRLCRVAVFLIQTNVSLVCEGA